VFVKNRQHFLMEEANGGEGTGGAGDGGILGDEGQGASGTGAGGGQGGGSGGSGEGQGANGSGGSGNGGGENPPKVTIPENWQDILPEEIRSQANLKNFKTVDALAKAYIHSQKMVGADKIAIPKNASDTELREIFEKLGLPKEADKYDVNLEKSDLSPEMIAAFKEQAFGLGIMPNQAKKLLEFFNNKQVEAKTSAQLNLKATFEKNMNLIKEEWGEAFNENAAKAKAALKEFGGSEDDIKYIRQNFGADPAVLRLLAKAGETLAEDKVRGEGGTNSNLLTPSQALAKIGQIKADINGPYFNPTHSDHAATKAEVKRLYELANPKKK
jgi:hypothetical protein